MRGILSLLAKANLVELSEEERAEQTEEPIAPPPPVEPPPVVNFPLSDNEIIESRPIEDIYAAAALPPSPFPAEKLLRLLDGLSAMDAATRKAAVVAMDAADDNWQITDSISDAERKIAVLNSYKQFLAAQLQSAEQQSVSKIEEIRSGLENSSSEIRKQISELEQLLEREVTKSAQQTTSIEAGVRNARELAGSESRRIDTEIGRLLEIPAQFKV